MASLSVPIIDISLLNLSNSTSIDEIDRQISKACEEWGFFYVINHGVDLKLIQQAVDLGKEFFKLPKDLKNEVARSEVSELMISLTIRSSQLYAALIVKLPRLFRQ